MACNFRSDLPQRRGIRTDVIKALLDFGRTRHLHKDDCEVVFFDNRGKAPLARERLTRAYPIIGSDGVVITRRAPISAGAASLQGENLGGAVRH